VNLLRLPLRALTLGARPALSTTPEGNLRPRTWSRPSSSFSCAIEAGEDHEERIGALFTQLPTGRIFEITTRSEMAEKENVVIEPATEADLDELSELLGELFAQESDFRPDKDKQLRGLRLIFEQPSRGRVFVLRRNGAIVGMINLLFTISTAEGGFVMLLEDLVVHTQYQGHGYGNKLLEHAIDFAKKKNFLRITLLTDRPENVAQAFFRKHGFIDSSMIPMRLWISTQNEGAESKE
jgi:N-acetylglutamate synthase-like GNAT family acetyltransferase